MEGLAASKLGETVILLFSATIGSSMSCTGIEGKLTPIAQERVVHLLWFGRRKQIFGI